MATITTRALDPVTWNPQYGNGQNNFISDLQAMVQIIACRLKLFQGEWFLNLLDGLPMFQSMLGSSASPQNIQAIINIISSRISQTQYVTKIISVSASYQNRQFKFSATVQTQFGIVYVYNTPGSAASLTTSN
jgi:hypothetical protein